MSNHDTDVLARLRAGADTVEEHRFDAHAVLAGSRRALRRRRSWQAVGACTTAAVVAFSLALAGPVPVPGLGDVTLPGSEQVRELLGIADADASRCEVPDPAVRQTPDPEAPASTRPRVTYHLTDARPISPCFDVRVDDTLPAAPGLTPRTVTADGAFWRTHQMSSDDGFLVGYQVFGTDHFDGTLTGDKNSRVIGLTAHGRLAAWYELEDAGSDGQPVGQRTIRVTGTAMGDIRTIGEAPLLNTSSLVMTDERIAWRHGATVSAAPVDGSEQPETLARQATAVGSDSDEIVVATLGQDADGLPTTAFTSYRDDGRVATLLTVNDVGGEPVSAVDITDDVLTYARGTDLVTLTVVPRVDGVVAPGEDQTIAVHLPDNPVTGLTAAGDAIVWESGPVAYLLRDTSPSRAGGPDLVRVGQNSPKERMVIGLAGKRIAWNTTTGSETSIHIGTLLEPEVRGSTLQAVPEGFGSRARTVPMAPTVTVPEDAVFRTYG
jgi:hypothetical protein